MGTDLLLIGGFLGSGKTTLLWKIAEMEAAAGRKSGLVTNDQASDLVDTELLKRSGQITEEVSGSCFCCNFPGFTEAVDHLCMAQVNEIIAEPVGSCTDLTATIVQPLQDRYGDTVKVMPFTVLADPAKLSDILAGGNAGLNEHAAYIIRKQMEEADMILINKTDLLSEEEKENLKQFTSKSYPLARIFCISALTGQGVNEWFTEVKKGGESGTHPAEVDYDIYAEGEAVLGWLNMKLSFDSEETEWEEFTDKFLTHLSIRFTQEGAAVGHVKMLLEGEKGWITGNLTGDLKTLHIRGNQETRKQINAIINARVEMAPKKLQDIVMEELEAVCAEHITYKIKVIRCLQPGRPNPTYRYRNGVPV